MHSSMQSWFNAGFLEMEDKGSTTVWEDKFHKCPTGLYRAYCSKCGKEHLPGDKYMIMKGSECCKVEFVPEDPTNSNAKQVPPKGSVKQNGTELSK